MGLHALSYVAIHVNTKKNVKKMAIPEIGVAEQDLLAICDFVPVVHHGEINWNGMENKVKLYSRHWFLKHIGCYQFNQSISCLFLKK